MRDRRDVLRVHRCRRTYDREKGRFTFDISYETHVELTERSVVVAEAFGLGVDESKKFQVLDAQLQVSPKDVVLVTGDSGSGKSVLLRAIREDLGVEAVDMSDVQVDEDKPIVESIGVSVGEALELLSKVGLNDAFLFLRSYRQLSDGQKYRFRLAKLVESGKRWWLMDEFCALLDRDTAKIIAFNVQKLARQRGCAVVAATTHDDLFMDLSPSVHVFKRFGAEIEIKYYPGASRSECSLLQDVIVEAGTLDDWRCLCGFHYRGHNVGARRGIFVARLKGWLVGVIVYSYPPLNCSGRRSVLPAMSIKDLNKNLSIVSRVVVHPKYRSIGLGEKLIRESLPLIQTRWVELVAVMPRYNPFAERAGMRKVSEHGPSVQALRLAVVLKGLGFDLCLLGSQRYVAGRLDGLSSEQVGALRTAFKKFGCLRFRRVFPAFSHVAYGTMEMYRGAIDAADLVMLGRLVKMEGVLLQTKVYLLWERPSIS